MDPKDWDDLAEAVIERLKSRVDPKWVPGIESEIAGGEYAMAIEDLIGILADDQVTVTAVERDELRKLIADMGDPETDVDQLNIADTGRR